METADNSDPKEPAKRLAWWLLPMVWCLWLLVSLVPTLLLGPYLRGASRLAAVDLALVSVTIAAALFIFTAWPFWIVLGGGSDKTSLARALARALLELVILLALACPFLMAASTVAQVGVRRLGVVFAFLAGVGVFAIGIRMLWLRIGPASGRWLLLVLLAIAAGPPVLDYLLREILDVSVPLAASVGPLGRAYLCAADGLPDSLWLGVLHLGIYPAIGLIHTLVMVLWPRRKVQPKDVVK
ncbi:MAG: hypothetical protein QGD94_09430 [Planctomycetia bacterium]|nr:hypothetical protein [Planctomycetia bacterium]